MSREVTISLESLYNNFNGLLNNGIIEKTFDGEIEYFDLYVNNQLACMDGETCAIIEESENGVVLANKNGKRAFTFALTKEEKKVGVYNNEYIHI